MDITKHMALLGFKVRDVVTGFEGVVETISFDLYGCVQAIVKGGLDKDKQPMEGRWFDVKRLRPIGRGPIMPVSSFEVVPGGSEKPAPHSKPIR